MILFDEDRASDSPFIERVWRCHSEGAHPFLSIAASRCELVVSRLGGKITVTVRGPETRATPMGDCPGDGEWLGILLKLGTFLPHLPTATLVDTGVDLPIVARTSFSLFGSVWQLPDYDNADTFVDWLVRKGELARDPVIDAALQGHLKDSDPSTMQRHFRRSTDPLAQIPHWTNTCPDPTEKPTRTDAVFVQDITPLDGAYSFRLIHTHQEGETHEKNHYDHLGYP